MEKAYLIVSSTEKNGIGTCSLISEDIWDVLHGFIELSSVPDEVLMELTPHISKNAKTLSHKLKEKVTDELESFIYNAQLLHGLIQKLSNEGYKSDYFTYFADLTLMTNNVRVNNIEILGSIIKDEENE